MRTETEIIDKIVNIKLATRHVLWAEIGFVNALFWVLGEDIGVEDLTEHRKQIEALFKKKVGE